MDRMPPINGPDDSPFAAEEELDEELVNACAILKGSVSSVKVDPDAPFAELAQRAARCAAGMPRVPLIDARRRGNEAAVRRRTPKRLSELSAPRRALVRLCQSMDYGQVLDLHIRDQEPVFSPTPVVLLDVKLDVDSCQRQESELADFSLRDEVRRLLERIDEIGNGRIQRIEVRAGIPRRVLIEAALKGAVR